MSASEGDRVERAVVDMVAAFVAREVRPAVRDLEREDRYPEALVGRMRQLGLFGLLVPEAYGGAGAGLETYAEVFAALSGGWMSLAGVLGTHSLVAYAVGVYGTAAQRAALLPGMATGEIRAAIGLTEPDAGSDLASLASTARPDGTGYRLTGTKAFMTNGATATHLLMLVRTEPRAEPPHRGMSLLMVPQGAPGLTVGRHLRKLGYRGVDTAEVVMADCAVPGDAVLGGVPGHGFAQAMSALEVGRINVAARAVGVGEAALSDAVRYARHRRAFGRPIVEHEAIQFYLAEMATKLRAARLLTLDAARAKDAGRRADLEAGMAKLFASEACQEVALAALRIHGGYGYTQDHDVERYYRDAPLMMVGEGTNEIQKLVIARALLRRMAD